MINSVAIQRLLEAAVMLKLERGTRVAGGPPPTAQTSNQLATTSQQPIQGATGNQNQRSALGRIWNNPPILPPGSAANGALAVAATVLRETAVAPRAYREAIAEAAVPARLPEQPAAIAQPVPAPIQYANAEIALALSVKTSRSTSGGKAAKISQGAATVPQSTVDTKQANQRRKIIIGAIIGGAIILIAVLASAVLI